ncbi:MAG: hypothetical protein M1829_006341 [Trizodia sp. TS-e1964]|nr:MAG: hypothetical protein M1829_006341 [Trizodia sp. TS-e1964]
MPSMSIEDVELLKEISRTGYPPSEDWPPLLERLLLQLEHICENEFTTPAWLPPTPRQQARDFERPLSRLETEIPSSQEDSSPNSQNKENAPPTVPMSRLHTASRPPTPSPPDDAGYPPQFHLLFASIYKSLQNEFSLRPPYTLQRFAELILEPHKYYRTMGAFLRALDRVVCVSSPADVFPLPVRAMPAEDTGMAANGFVPMPDVSLGGDASLGGAMLSPIPWLLAEEGDKMETMDALIANDELDAIDNIPLNGIDIVESLGNRGLSPSAI